eukprot:140714_1
MCGILAILGLVSNADACAKRSMAVSLSRRLIHRGPDWSGCLVWNNCILAHERLSIVDIVHGSQPILNKLKTLALVVNGEIYNHNDLKKELKNPHAFQTSSDCEPLMHLYAEFGENFIDLFAINGMFAFVVYDRETGAYMAARDHMGIIPLYIGWSKDGSIWFASEMKALIDHCESYIQFPPGHVYSSKNGKLRRFYTPLWLTESEYTDDHIDFAVLTPPRKKSRLSKLDLQSLSESTRETPELQRCYEVSAEYVPRLVPTFEVALAQLRTRLIKSVTTHLMADVPFGVLLSGGLDSSLVAAIAARHLRTKDAARIGESISKATECSEWLRLESFCIGLKGSPDLAAAQKVAEHIGTKHIGWTFTVDEGLDALEEVIRHIETYDVTSIRASTPMYLLSRRIKATGIKMVLSGEGADEIFGGYLYFHKAPNPKEFQEESVRKMMALYQYDCLRANKSTMAFGLEARVPFLDRQFVNFTMSLDPSWKMVGSHEPRIEKYILRKAFDVTDDSGQPMYLPKEVLWRQKEQFSDGVGYSWIDSVKVHANSKVTDQQMSCAKHRFPINTPATKEAYLYREIFTKYFPSSSAAKTVPGGPSIACSTSSAIKWDKSFGSMADPSGRAVGVHADAYEEKDNDNM